MRDKQKEETRKKLYHAALEIFGRDGVNACRIEDIAQLAQVSRAAFYFHFPSKDDVLLELVRESEDSISEQIEALPATASLHQVIHTLLDAMARFWTQERLKRIVTDVFTVYIRRRGLETDPESDPVRVSLARRFQSFADRAQLSPLAPAERLSDLFLLNCFAVLASWGVDASMPLVDLLRGTTMLFMNGARHPEAPPFILEG